jgi:hypothetical protein
MEKFKKIKLQVLDDEDKVIGTVNISLEAIKNLKETHNVDALNLAINTLVDEIEAINNKKK